MGEVIVSEELRAEAISAVRKLDRIRQISNCIQAMENLVTQMEDVDGFEDLFDRVKMDLQWLRRVLREEIHGGL